MRFLCIQIILCSFPLGHESLEYVRGMALTELQHKNNFTSNATSCNEDRRLDCDGCYVQLVCDYERNIISRLNCPASKPYCDHGTCSNEPSPICATILGVSEKKSNLCPSAGFFPHPLSCARFHYCTADLRSILHICPKHYAFDPLTDMCKRRRKPQDCPVIDCARHQQRFRTYPLDRNNMIFDEEVQQCAYKCPEGEGKFPYPENEGKFYLCIKDVYGEVVPFLMSCGKDQVFSVTDHCIPAWRMATTQQTTTTVASSTADLVRTETTATTEGKETKSAIAFVPVQIVG